MKLFYSSAELHESSGKRNWVGGEYFTLEADSTTQRCSNFWQKLFFISLRKTVSRDGKPTGSQCFNEFADDQGNCIFDFDN